MAFIGGKGVGLQIVRIWARDDFMLVFLVFQALGLGDSHVPAFWLLV